MLPSPGVASLPKALDPGGAQVAQSEGMFVLSWSAAQHMLSFLVLTVIKSHTHTHTHPHPYPCTHKQQLTWI